MRRRVDLGRTPFGFLVARPQREELVAEHAIREHHRGRALSEILGDAYVVNRLSEAGIARLLDRPDVLHAVGDDLAAAHLRTAARSAS